MQSYKEEKLLRAEIGSIPELVQRMPESATHHVIGRIPAVGAEVIVNGIVWVVERVKEQHGWMRLRLKGH